MKKLQKNLKIGKKIAPNRFVFLPTESNTGDEYGKPTELTYKKYIKMAEGLPGVVFIEAMTVDPKYKARVNQLYLSDENIDDYKNLINKMRSVNDECLIFFQLDHPGELVDESISNKISIYNGREDIATVKEIEEILEKFLNAAVLAHEAGADGIDLKQAHGFFCCDLLRPGNLRNDDFGGTFQNRMRFFNNFSSKFKKKFANDFLFGTRISAFEGIRGGFGTSGSEEVIEDLHETFKFVEEAQQNGAAFIVVSAGHATERLDLLIPSDNYPEAVYRHFGWQKKIKEIAKIPVIGSGYSYLRDGTNNLFEKEPEKKSFKYWAEKNICDGVTDAVGFGRQGLADPFFPNKYLSDDISSINFCTACGGCGNLLVNQKPTGCIIYNEYFKHIHDQLEK